MNCIPMVDAITEERLRKKAKSMYRKVRELPWVRDGSTDLDCVDVCTEYVSHLKRLYDFVCKNSGEKREFGEWRLVLEKEWIHQSK